MGTPSHRRRPALPTGPQQAVLEGVGDYLVGSFLGAGAVGAVYRARRLDSPEEVALKLIHPYLAPHPMFIERRLYEARAAMNFEHRAIVRTRDVGSVGDRHYIVSELVDGVSLLQLCGPASNELRIPVALALWIGVELCAALEAIHYAGALHSDISPSNVLLSTRGEIKLTDFGGTRAIGSLGEDGIKLLTGKLGYLAPEQLDGAPGPSADIFSVGAVLYELLCQRPFRRDPTLTAVRAASPPDALPLIHAKLPDLLIRTIIGSLAPRSVDRPRDARSFAGRLKAQLAAIIPDGKHQQRLGLFVREHVVLDPHRTNEQQRAVLLARRVVEQARAMRQVTGPMMPIPMPAAEPPEPARLAKTPRWLWLVTGLVCLVAVAVLIGIWIGGTDDGRRRMPSTSPMTQAHADVGVAPVTRGKGAALTLPPIRARDAGAADSSGRRRRDGARRDSARRENARKLPRWGWLAISCEPWATVFVDGKRRGQTRHGKSLKLRLHPGEHRVQLFNELLKTSRSTIIRIRPGRQVKRSFNLHK